MCKGFSDSMGYVRCIMVFLVIFYLPNVSRAQENPGPACQIVQRGDALDEIALRYSVTFNRLRGIKKLRTELIFGGQHPSQGQISLLNGALSEAVTLYRKSPRGSVFPYRPFVALTTSAESGFIPARCSGFIIPQQNPKAPKSTSLKRANLYGRSPITAGFSIT
jgi:hypothetical protein